MKLSRALIKALIFSVVLSLSIKAHAQNPVTVDSPFQIKLLSSSSEVDSVVSIVNSGARGAAVTPGNTAATTGAICANVYAYSGTDGTLISCCSCPVAPNASRVLSVNTDLIQPPTSTKLPTRTVVKLLASTPVGGSCANSSASPGALTAGLLAWGTSALPLLQVHPQISINQQAESPFSPATLSAGELSKMTTQCAAFTGGGTNRVCTSCPN